jgi:hypothetical protein
MKLKKKINGQYYNLYTDKNGGICDITVSEVISWKEVKGKKIPEEIKEERDNEKYYRVVGRPLKIALNYLYAANED